MNNYHPIEDQIHAVMLNLDEQPEAYVVETVCHNSIYISLRTLRSSHIDNLRPIIDRHGLLWNITVRQDGNENWVTIHIFPYR